MTKRKALPKLKGKTFKATRSRLFQGDCLKILPKLPPNSIDSAVIDPPYHLASIVARFGKEGSAPAKVGKTGAFARASRAFVGKKWDDGDVAFKASTWKTVFRVMKPGAFLAAFGIPKNSHRLKCAIEDAGFEVRDDLLWLFGSGFPKSRNVAREIERTLCRKVKGEFLYDDGEPMRREPPFRHPKADEWYGWATALKPAYEHVVLARKPINGTLVDNVLKWGTGALNIEAGQIPVLDGDVYEAYWQRSTVNDITGGRFGANKTGQRELKTKPGKGRWPANVLHDGSIDSLFPVGESRFFYSAKADSDDRAGSGHPTIKPLDVIRYLCRLITPPGGTILDCFAGTGTLGEAAFYEGFSSILIERDADACSDIARRMRLVFTGPQERRREIIKATGKTADAGPLFAGLYDQSQDRGAAPKH